MLVPSPKSQILPPVAFATNEAIRCALTHFMVMIRVFDPMVRRVSVCRILILAGLIVCVILAGAFAQEDLKTVTVEVYLPEGARLFIEHQEMKFTAPMRRFVSPPLLPGKYVYTIKAIIPGPNGPRTVTRRIDVRPGDFESIDLRAPGKRPITDVEYEPTPQKVVDALLRLAKVTSKDVVWDLGCGD